MAFDATNPVSVGGATKKAHFDQLLANDVLLKTSISNDGLTWGSTVLSTGTVGYHLGASGTSYGFVGTNTNHDFYLRRNGSNILQITANNVLAAVGTPANYQYAALSLQHDLRWIQLGANGGAVLQGVGAGLFLAYNVQWDGAGSWRNISNAVTGMLGVNGGSIDFYLNASPGAAYTAFSPTLIAQVMTTGWQPGAHNSYDIGLTGTRWRAGWFQGAVTAAGGFVGNLTGNVTGNVTGTASGNLTGLGISGGTFNQTYSSFSITVNSDGLVTAISGTP